MNFFGFFCLFRSRSTFNDRSHERCNEAWHYVIQLVVWVSNDFFELKHVFYIISPYGCQLIQKCR